MTSRPTTPVRVPRGAASYTTETLDMDLRSQINSVLLREGHVRQIYDALSTSLSGSQTNWPTAIREHALSLLRSGECTTFPALMARVTADVKAATNEAKKHEAAAAAGSTNGTVGAGTANGAGEVKFKGKAAGLEHLAVPSAAVEEGVRVTRECLDAVCELED